MKQLFIPTIGSELILAADWSFKVFNETRNETLIRWMGKVVPSATRYSAFPLGEEPRADPRDYEWYEKSKARFITCTLPKGSVLRVDRIYIRRGLKDFDSVTFFLKGAKTKADTRQRTMTKLSVRKPGVVVGAYGLFPEYDREEIPYVEKLPARGVRFWAKLDDVNLMKIK